MTPEIANSPENIPIGSSRPWEIVKDLLPVVTAVLTALLTFIVWFTQHKMEQKVDKNQLSLQAQIQTQQAQLQAQLALREEFYKHRLMIYENACRQIADAETSLADVGTTDESGNKALNLVKELDKLRRGNQLYWSKQVDSYLDKLWTLGICRAGSVPCEIDGSTLEVDALTKEIKKAVGLLHEQMKTDLEVR